MNSSSGAHQGNSFNAMQKGVGVESQSTRTRNMQQPSPSSATNAGSNSKPPLKFMPDSVSSSWKDICEQGRQMNSDSALEFIEPIKKSDGEQYASILRSEIAENIMMWSNTLVGYVMGNKPFYLHLKA